MTLVPRVRATIFLQEMGSASSRPGLFICGTGNGDRQEYVVKYHGKLQATIISEFVAALVGHHLGLPIPPVAIVDIAPELASLIRSSGTESLSPSDPGPHFGSRFVSGGKMVLPSGFRVRDRELPTAIDIFAFDMLIQNVDRAAHLGAGKPNLLDDGAQITIIDHEKAFSFLFTVGDPPPPWELRGLPFVSAHLFFRDVRRRAGDDAGCFRRFLARVETISDSFLDNVVSAVPQNWSDPEKIDGIVSHLKLVRENVSRFERGLLEALA